MQATLTVLAWAGIIIAAAVTIALVSAFAAGAVFG